VLSLIRAHHREQHALANGDRPVPVTDDPRLLQLSAADKIVSLATALGRATASGDPGAYWAARPTVRHQLRYLNAFYAATAPRLPDGMARELGYLIANTDPRDLGPGQP